MSDPTTPAGGWKERWEHQEGDHWVAEADRYDTMAAPFGEAMLDAADLRAGEQVLDVGCGNGATTLDAARRVIPGGTVVGIDVSSRMLDLARTRAAAAGVREIEFLHADAETHRFPSDSFDVIVSRAGLLFFEQPEVAFANLAANLRRGGRIAFTAWRGPEHSEWIMVAGVAAAPYIGIPEGIEPGAPGPYALADPDRIRSLLGGAGFTVITVDGLTRPMRIGTDIDDAVAFLTSIPLVRELLARASTDQQAEAEEAVRAALVPYAGRDGVVMEDNGGWLVVARR